MHAELILNLIWIALACGVFALVFGRENKGKSSLGTKFVVAALLVIILFPAISMTDDLHNPVIASSDGERLSLLERAAIVAIVISLFYQLAIYMPVFSRFAVDRDCCCPSDGFGHATSGRAPPLAA